MTKKKQANRPVISPQAGPQTTFAKLSPGDSGSEDGTVLAFYGGASKSSGSTLKNPSNAGKPYRSISSEAPLGVCSETIEADLTKINVVE